MQQADRIHKLNKRVYTNPLPSPQGPWKVHRRLIFIFNYHSRHHATQTHDNEGVEIPLTGRSKVIHPIWALEMATTEEDREK